MAPFAAMSPLHLTASMRVMKALAFLDPSLATVKAMSKSIEYG